MQTALEAAESIVRVYPERIRPGIRRRIELAVPLTWEQYEKLSMNSYERAAIYHLMDNECLERVVRYNLKNCISVSRNLIPTTYEDTLVNILAPLLLERMMGVENIIIPAEQR